MAVISKHKSSYSEIHNEYNKDHCTEMHYITMEMTEMCLGRYVSNVDLQNLVSTNIHILQN